MSAKKASAVFSGKRKASREVFEDAERNMADDSHIFCGMVFPDTAVVLLEGHIQAPMERSCPFLIWRIWIGYYNFLFPGRLSTMGNRLFSRFEERKDL